MRAYKSSRSSRQLAAVLRTGGKFAEACRNCGIHKTQLWRYATGRGKPDAEQVAKLHRATNGRVAAYGWETDYLDDELVA